MNRSVKDIFLDAIDLPADRRMEFVHSQTDDPAVREAVMDLLAAHAVAPTLQPARVPAAASLDEIKPGEVIGDYTLVRKLGEGAFGMVYLARQTEPVVRDVAIKLLKHGHDSRQIVARFEGERQALALMDHPHIARIYDAGETATGRPYFVMEYVAGEPITDYCRRRALSLSAQLELFSQVCLAIQHAHQKGVIHRDLKPSNILVSELDGAANPKVIDFGIAKALDVEHLPSITVEAQILGTPQYMSPEQATFDRANVDTRSDVYSLGTVLYELLVGAPPFDPAELQTAGLESMCRVIREKPPARPSTRVAEALRAPKPTTTLVSPPSVELDWIVLKALEKEPSRRYQTAADLAADLDRFLRHKPVLAGPPSRLYQLRKFIRRHRIETAAAAVVMMALVGTAIVSLVMASRARKAEADARSELTRAQAVSDFTETVLGGVAPATARGRDTTLLKELLGEAAAEVPEITKDHPGVEAFVRGMIGKAYADLAQDQEALKQYEIAYAAGKSAREADLPGVYRTNMRYAMVLSARGRDDEARRILGEIIDGYNALPGDWTKDKLETMVNLAAIHLDTGRTQDAEAILIRVLDLNQQTESPNAQLGMIAQNNLAIARLRMGKTAEALKTWEGLLVFQRKYIGDDHPNTLGTLNNLASAHEMLDQNADAEKYYREALATKRRILPAGHQSLIRSIQNLGQHLAAKNQLEEASALLDEAMELCRKHLGNEHDLTYSVMLRVSRLRIKQKRIDEAIAMGSEVRKGYGKLYAESDARAVQATMLLLLTYLDTGRHAEGAALWREIESKGYIADQTADTRIKLFSAAAGLLDGAGDRAAALVWFEKAKALVNAPGVASDGISRFKKVAARFEATTRPG